MAKGGDEGARVVPGNGRPLQVAPTGRKLFGKAAKKAFLEQLAATCNVSRSAEAAGFGWRVPYAHRMKDAAFREAWDRALEQGYAKLEALLLERAMRGPERIPVAGDADVDISDMDTTLAMDLLRQHARVRSGEVGRGRAKGGAPPTRASMDEVRARVIKKLKAIGVRPE